jgi:hypothetical protein
MLSCLTCLLLVTSPGPLVNASEGHEIAQTEFQLVWSRTEAPVASGVTERSWLWGPEPRTPGMNERYLDSPGQMRLVQYFDKGRMEVNDLSADPSDPWFVTSGLLTREMISGKIQIGDDAFLDAGEGAAIHVAGDPMSPFPHYRDLAELIDNGSLDRTGERADQILTPGGLLEGGDHPDDPDSEFVRYEVYHGPAGTDVGYNIPRAFWNYLNASGIVYDSQGQLTTANPLFSWIYVMGYPISDPFWVEVSVGGQMQWVLVQPFERRVLTYTPANPVEWQVEMGNIGQHYRDWRSPFFGEAADGGDPTFFGLVDDERWRYSTSYGVDEVWDTVGTSDSFIPGSITYARDELKLEARRTTYWSMGDDGLYLHGWELRDGQGNIRSMVVYGPAIHILPSSHEETVLTTDTVAISMHHPPVEATIDITVGPQQLVSTPAGVFRTWRMASEEFGVPEVDHRQGLTFWFEPEVGIIQWIDGDFSAHLVSSSVLND